MSGSSTRRGLSLVGMLLACLALAEEPGIDAAFVGTWELVALSQEGRPRACRGRLVVSPGRPGRAAGWSWDLAHQPPGDLETTRRAGQPWPTIGRHTPRPWAGSYHDRGGEGVYRLSGPSLTIARAAKQGPGLPEGDPFAPAVGRTIEAYRRVDREPPTRPTIHPSGPAKLLATWDEAQRGFYANHYRGILDHFALYDLGDGVKVIRLLGVEPLDDPPAPDLDPEAVPTGTIVRPPGGRFNDATYDIIAPTPSPEAAALIAAFRAQNPEVPGRRRTYWGFLPPTMLVVPGERFSGWDGIVLTTRRDGDRTIADISLRPRVVHLTDRGTWGLANVAPRSLETWELRGGTLRYLGGGPELDGDDLASTLIPAAPTPTMTPVRPRPPGFPPVDRVTMLPTVIHYRPDRIDPTDSSKNSVDAPAPDSSSLEFTIFHAFNVASMMPTPADRAAFFAEVLSVPQRRQARWEAIIKSAEAEGEGIRAEILVWPLVADLEGGRFRTVSVRPFRETWLYRGHRLRFVSGGPAAAD